MWVYKVWLWLILGVYGRKYVGVMEAAEDTLAAFYIDGTEVPTSSAAGELLVNSRHAITSTRNVNGVFNADIVAGQTLALHGRHFTSDDHQRMYNPDGRGDRAFNSSGAMILALDDGTITNDLWECRDMKAGTTVAWNLQQETNWFPAFDGDVCCPWREASRARWSALGAKYIWSSNWKASEVLCRYTKVHEVDRTMDGSQDVVDPDAAMIHVQSIYPHASFARVVVTVSKAAKVRVMTIAKSSFLRTPTPAEFAKINSYATVEERNINTWWDLTDSTNYMHMMSDAEPIDVFVDVRNEGACRGKCDEIPACRRIIFTWRRVCFLYAIGMSASVEYVSLEDALTQHLAKEEHYKEEAANAPSVAKLTKLVQMYAIASQMLKDALAQLKAEAAAATQSPRRLNNVASWSAQRPKTGDVDTHRLHKRHAPPARTRGKADRVLAEESYAPAVAFMHMGATFEARQLVLQVGEQGLFSGTEYIMFLSAEGTSWERIAASRVEFTTTGCSLSVCRMTAWPEVIRLGGMAGGRSVSLYVSLNRRGSVWCMPYSASRMDPPTVSHVMSQANQFDLTDVPSSRNAVTVFTYTFNSLMMKSTYYVYCATKAPGVDGSLITQGSMELTRVMVRTTDHQSTIYAMENITQITVDDEVQVSLDVVLSEESALYCTAQVPYETLNDGMPRDVVIEAEGTRVFAKQGTVAITVLRPLRDATYEVYCNAKLAEAGEGSDAIKQTTAQAALYPKIYVESADVDYSKINLIFMVDQEATVRCLPVEASLSAPTVAQVVASSWSDNIDTVGGGRLPFRVRDLSPGTNYVLYCHTEQLTTNLEKYAMTHTQMLDAAYPFRTLGPDGSNYVVTCDVGFPCQVSLAGEGLSWGDRIWASPKPCRRNCRCGTIMDPSGKGATCFKVSQKPSVPVPGPLPEDHEEDPFGAWCYVDPLDECTDTQPSEFYHDLYVSYLACESGALRGLPGFPNGGLSLALNGGYNHTWGPQRLNATARMLHLCWCAGTMQCTGAEHFALPLGSMLLRGASGVEVVSDHVCQFGRSCIIPFHGLAVAPVSTLIAIPPIAHRTCYRNHSDVSSSAYDPGLLLPNGGMAVPTATREELAKEELSFEPRRVPFRFGNLSDAAVAEPGTYQLCYCAECTERRVGTTHLATAGYLNLAGPKLHQKFTCDVGTICDILLRGKFAEATLEQVSIIAADRCGTAPVAPFGWFTTDDALVKRSGLSAGHGWLNNATGLAHLTALYDPWEPQLGAYGFAQGGVANVSRVQHKDQVRVGVRWALPVLAVVGSYQLCWRVAPLAPQAVDITQFYSFGDLAVAGVALFPHAGYVRECGREAPCTITNVNSYKALRSRVLIVRGTCGAQNQLLHSFPNKGLSLPSHDGNTFPFGSDVVREKGGAYSMCWCGAKCAADVRQFLSFAGELRVVAPSFSCVLVVLAVPAENASAALARFAAVLDWTDPRVDTATVTQNESILSMIPYIEMRGVNSYAVEIQLSSQRDAEQVVRAWQESNEHLARPLITAAPKFYCAQNEPCAIYGFFGSYLSDKNRVMVAHACGESSGVEGFPNRGMSSSTFRNGTAFRWDGNITAAAGKYQLCWCWRDCAGPMHFTTSVGPFIVLGPWTTEEHLCYDRAPRRCAFPLAHRGLDQGDRVVALPIEADCRANEDASIAATYGELPFFPGNGFSLRVNGSLFVDFGPGKVHMTPRMLRLCWCRSAQNNCTENALTNFVLPGGLLRIGSLEEFYQTHKPNFVYDAFDTQIFVFLTCPLPMFCCIALLVWRKAKRHRIQNMKAQEEAKRAKDETHARKVLSTSHAKCEAIQDLFDHRFKFSTLSNALGQTERPGSAPSRPLDKSTRSRRLKRPDSAPIMKRWRGELATLPRTLDTEDDDELLDSDDESIYNVGGDIDDIPFAPSSDHAPYIQYELPRQGSHSAISHPPSVALAATPKPPPLPHIVAPRVAALPILNNPRRSAPPTFNVGHHTVPTRPTASLLPRDSTFSVSSNHAVSPKAVQRRLMPIGQKLPHSRWTTPSAFYITPEDKELQCGGDAAAFVPETNMNFRLAYMLRDIN